MAEQNVMFDRLKQHGFTYDKGHRWSDPIIDLLDLVDSLKEQRDKLDRELFALTRQAVVVNCSTVFNNTMFVGTERGLFYYDPKEETLKRVPHAEGEKA